MLKPSRESRFDLEALEGRRLLSAAIGNVFLPINVGATLGAIHQVKTIEFDQAPAAAQSGLESLATADQLTTPTATQSVTLGNSDGVESYSITLGGSGTTTTLSVDQNGDDVTAPIRSKTTFGTLSGSGTNSNTAAASEIAAIADHLGVTAPSSATVVHVTTGPGSAVTYNVNLGGFVSISLNPPGTFSILSNSKKAITVDENGNPVGNQKIPFSVMPTAIQNNLNGFAPAGTALASDSNKTVTVETADGQTTYAVVFKTTGVRTRITINSSGQLADLPTIAATTFSDVPTAAQTGLQGLASDIGLIRTVGSSEPVSVYTETDGTVIYTLGQTSSHVGGNSLFSTRTVSVDEDGNPTLMADDAPAPDLSPQAEPFVSFI